MEIFYIIISILFWPIVVIGLIVFFVRRRNRKEQISQNDANWYLQIALSKEDGLSQSLLLLSLLFLGVTLFAFNRDFGDPLSWRSIIFITSLIGLVGAYYLKVLYAMIFSLVGLVIWWGAQAVQWAGEKDIKMSAAYVGLSLIMLFFYSLGHLHGRQIRFKRFGFVYMILSIIFITMSLFLFSTRIGIEMLEDMIRGAYFFGSWQITLSLFAFFILSMASALYAMQQKIISIFELGAVIALHLLSVIIVLLPEMDMTYRSVLSSAGVLWAVIFNLAIFFELLGLIFSGYLRRETWLINMGVVFLSLLIVLKYFDWFFTFLDKSIFFIGAGILLFVVGWFMEKSRRYMISEVKAQAGQVQP